MTRSARVYLFAFLALAALSGLTFGLSFVPLGAAAMPVALTIALAKASIVVLFFMHLREHASSDRAALVVGLLLALLLVGFVVADVLTRTRPALTPPGF